MLNQNSLLLRFALAFSILFFSAGALLAQDDDDDSVGTAVTVSEPKVMVRSLSRTQDDSEDDSKVTGATVRGRVVYEDTNRPVRYALISLVPEKESFTSYGSKFVKTDENGEFVLKNVKAGSYVAYVKSEGVLNRESFKTSYRQSPNEKKAPENFEKIVVAGLGEIQVVVAARRGGAITGRIAYADGEPAVGVKVEALRSENGRYAANLSGSEDSLGQAVTDDRGGYRIAGLPEGEYIVRVVEPASHTSASAQYLYNYRNDGGASMLRTYYPEGDNAANAKKLEVSLGQEQAAIDLIIPDRRLYSVAGRILKKGTGEPLKGFTINFIKLSDRDGLVAEFFSPASGTSNSAGEWSLKSLLPGKYRVSIAQPYDYSQNKEPGKKPAQYPNMAREIEITDKNLADVNFEVPVEASISGTITVEGGKDVPAEARLFAYDEESKALAMSEIDYSQYQTKKPAPVKEKSFRIAKLNEGRYLLTSMNSQSFYLKSATAGGRDLLNSPFEIKEGDALTGVQVVISTNMGAVKGKVDGYKSPEQAFVVLVKAGVGFEQAQMSSFSAPVKSNGDFEVKAAPGEYSIFVFSRKQEPKTQAEARAVIENLIKDARKITIREAEDVNVSLAMPD